MKLKKEDYKLKIIVILFILVFFIGVGGFHFLLDLSFTDAFYLTIVTLTTVGYGDITPLKRAEEIGGNIELAQFFTVFLILFGMGILAFAISEFTEYVLSGDYQEYRNRKSIEKRILKLKNHYIICGSNKMSKNIIIELEKTRRDYVIIDEKEKNIEPLLQRFSTLLYVIGDPTDEEVLFSAGIDRTKGVMITLDDEKENLMISMTIKSRFELLKRKKPRIISRINDEKTSRQKFLSIGVDSVISTSYIGGRRMVSEVLRPSVTTFLDRMLMEAKKNVRIEEIVVNNLSSIRSISSVNEKFSINILAVKREDEIISNPDFKFQIELNDILILMGEMKNIVKMRRVFKSA